MASLGDRIYELRSSYGLTFVEMAYQINKKYDTKLNRGLISRWEKGTFVPDTKYIVIMADFFNVSIEYLLGISDTIGPLRETSSKDLTRKEQRIMKAYREASDEIKGVVDSILKVK